MIIEIENLKGFSGGWSGEGKRCNYCKTAAAAAFCRSDSTFLCLNCDTKIHEVNKLSSRHERVWMCEVCEQAPAAVTCKADAAALCVTCDADIHAANPLARRHERVPVEPFYDSAESIVNSSSPINFLVPIETDLIGSACPQEETEGTSSWLLPNQNQPSKLGLENHDVKPAADLFFSEMYPDPYLDFEYPNSVDVRFRQRHHSAVTDSLVPVQTKPAPILVMNNKNCLDIDMCKSKISPFNYAAHTLSQSVSSSSMDAGVVPDGNSMSEISYSFSGTLTNGVDPSVWVSAGANQAAQLCGIDREARVLRYREKRKNRKFEKTIRYASRKAYAETRPRIKGRFAKRTEVDKEVAMDRFYGSQASAAFMADTQYGIVPSF